MGTRSFIIIQERDCFRGIYCHWDGYFEGNGSILEAHYNRREQVQALIDSGDLSSLGCSVEECTYYKDRGDPWNHIKPATARKLEELLGVAEGSGCEFVYVFDSQTSMWRYAERGPQYFGLSDGSKFSEFKLLAEQVSCLEKTR